jgi:hypothetical protein
VAGSSPRAVLVVASSLPRASTAQRAASIHARECMLHAQGTKVGPSVLPLLWQNSSVALMAMHRCIRREGGAVLTVGLWTQDGVAGVSRGRGVRLPCRKTTMAPQATAFLAPVPPSWQ